MINNLLKLYLLTFGINVYGVDVLGFSLTIPTIVVLTLVLYSIPNRKMKTNIAVPLFVFIGFCFVSTILYHDIGFIYSLGMLTAMALPLVFEYEERDLVGFEKYLRYGFILTLPIVAYDLGVTFLGLEPLEAYVPFFRKATNSPLSSYFGYYRVKSTFTEPSYYGIYLCTLLYIGLKSKAPSRYLWVIFGVILATVSLTAVVISGFIFAHWAYSNGRIGFRYVLLFVAILLFLPAGFDLIINRITETFSSISSSSFEGSEGVRANSIFVMFNYLNEGGVKQFFLGEGYSHYDKWLIERFKGNPLIGYSRGQIFNAFAVVGLSVGVLGLLLYLNLLFRLSLDSKFNRFEIGLHAAIQFSLAFIVSYLFWGVLILIGLSNAHSRFKQLKNHPHDR
ncbi:hypothetical protein HZ996_04830 [Cryomorphaceae bacterium]|nr:hypothetical protein HZ996_04830 [Cryomorphaceae bacterium]